MASGPYYSPGAQSSTDFYAPPNTRPSDFPSCSSAFPNGTSQPWMPSNEQIFHSISGYHSSSSQIYDVQPDARMQQLLLSDQSTALSFTQHPSFGGPDVLPQSHYHAVPHSHSGSNNSYTPFAEPQSRTKARANPTPYGTVTVSADVFHDQHAAINPHGVPSTFPPYPINIPTPSTNHIYPPPGASSSAANPIRRRGRDETAIADRRKVDAQFECPHPDCIANFTTKGACKKHWESKHEGRRFRCIMKGCEKEYADDSSLGRHLRLIHNTGK
ncbi:hypothetical protein CPB85DRAFT_1431472 [Mucidula mucida]|nr:hypothetical protein CPB85DRAFT_1431472 [Mucidula mucida]